MFENKRFKVLTFSKREFGQRNAHVQMQRDETSGCLRACFSHRSICQFSEKNHTHSESCALSRNRKKKYPYRARFCAKKCQSCDFRVCQNTPILDIKRVRKLETPKKSRMKESK